MRVGCTLIVCATLLLRTYSYRTDQQFWKELAKDELEEALRVKWNMNTAKNVIIFIGDGMGPNTVTATRIYKGGEGHRLSYEKFPHVGLLKTYSANKMVPDSSCTATALLCGIKANQMTIGLDASVKYGDCSGSLKPEARLTSLAALALKAGKSVGVVTTMRVTHATPSPMYAHSADRQWECDSKMPDGTVQCKDIARQLVEDWPGKDLHVILGGGRQALGANINTTKDPWSCSRKDGRNLVKAYEEDKQTRQLKYTLVSNNEELKNFNIDDTDYLFGIFADSHMNYEHERDRGPSGSPSLSDMFEAAVKVLNKNKKGFLLMVEGGNIDMAHHRGKAKKAVDESAAMEDAVQLATNVTNDSDTLLIVTSDHGHTLTINGYPYRGSNIFGIAGKSPHDGINYTTLSYGTGGPSAFKYHLKSDQNKSVISRKDPSLENTDDYEYEQAAAVTIDENSHGGGDVIVYARGPWSHLFHNVHEQHYVYLVVSYAAKIGDYAVSRADLQTTSSLINISLFLVFLNYLNIYFLLEMN